MKLKRFFSIPIVLVFCLMSFIYYVTIFFLINNWLNLQSSVGSLHALIFTFVASLCFFSFLVCILTDPGGIPSAYLPDVEENDSSDQEATKTGRNQRLCDKCSAFKPPRTHHCRVCRKCVLRMDHHCVWINNCVGHRNYKAFFVLVFYATMASIYSLIIFIGCVFQKDLDFSGNMPLMIFYISYGIMTVGLSVTLGTLLGWHVYLTARNMTTIEYYESKRKAWLANKSGLLYHHAFDVGTYRNISLVLGPNVLKWLIPTARSHIKDGLSFPTARDNS
ncbi:protein modifying enzyme [Lithospermum erythrorhizon]|uniref:S-acyltransferase n=1 Tax=Lithospermum erythrorhizon TaxID=34254 RepID=A0AAV3NMB3_LITER